MTDLICGAIDNRLLLEFYYHGHHRLVEPYTLGYNTLNNLMLCGYQVDGTRTSAKPLPDWGQFNISEVDDLKVSDKSFLGNAPGYVRGDSRMADILCEL